MVYKPDMESPSTRQQPPVHTGAIVRAHAHRGIAREPAILPGEHFADVITLDQPASGEPPQYPHAHVLGNDGDGLRCQFSGGAKVQG
jgi:hypothetical protein